MAVTNGVSEPKPTDSSFSSIPACIEAFAAGQFLIVLDAPTRENEGDLIISARHLTPSKAAFMIRYTSGYLCAPLSPSRAKLLDLPSMVKPSENEDPNRTAYCVTVDATGDGIGSGVTTGISAHDRSKTCNVLADANAVSVDLRRPGHVVPLIAREGGVRERRGHTEAGWEFARLAGITPEVAVIGEMVVDGEPPESGVVGSGSVGEVGVAELRGAGMMRMKECLEFGRRWGIRCCTIEDLAKHVEVTEGPLEGANGS